MSGIEPEILILIFVIFAAGTFLGVVVITAIAYRREDRHWSLPDRAPNAVCQGARRLTGVGTIGPAGWIPEQRPGEQRPGGDDDAPRAKARL